MKKVNWNTRKTIIIDGEKVTASAAMLNRISLWIQKSADADDRRGWHAIAKASRELGKDIYCQLEAMGFYNDIK